MKQQQYSFKRPAILGLGKTGLSLAQYLVNNGVDNFTVMDSRQSPPGTEELKQIAPQVRLICGDWNKALLDEASIILASPGVDLRDIKAVGMQAPIIGDVELFAIEAKAPIIAVTGTNGKSSVVSLLGEMATAAGINACVAGNIGLPVLEALALVPPDFYVLELSSFQLETTYHLNAFVSVILNIAEDHMDRHDGFSDYLQAKQRIYTQAQHALINSDSPACWQGVVDEATADSFSYKRDHAEPLLSACLLQTPHQHENALAAIALGRRMGLADKAMAQALAQFSGLAHRCQLVCERDEVRWYNDSKATNVSSAIAAITSVAALCQGRIIWIAGGQGKGQDFSPLKKVVAANVAQVILFGQDASIMQHQFAACTRVTLVSDLLAAIDLAKIEAKPQDIVLFSPACASFDMFDNFEHRGRVFANTVSAHD